MNTNVFVSAFGCLGGAVWMSAHFCPGQVYVYGRECVTVGCRTYPGIYPSEFGEHFLCGVHVCLVCDVCKRAGVGTQRQAQAWESGVFVLVPTLPYDLGVVLAPSYASVSPCRQWELCCSNESWIRGSQSRGGDSWK